MPDPAALPTGVTALGGPVSVPVAGGRPFECHLVLLADGQIGFGDATRFLALGASGDVQRVAVSRGEDSGTALATIVIGGTRHTMTLRERPGAAINRMRALGFTVGTRPVPGAAAPQTVAPAAVVAASPRAAGRSTADAGDRAGKRSAWGWARVHPKSSMGAAAAAVLVIVLSATSSPSSTTTPASTVAAHAGSSQVAHPSSAVPAAPTTALPPATEQVVPVLPVPAATSAQLAHAAVGTALAALATLPVAPDSSMDGYSRAQFGSAWSDDNGDLDGHNGCDTRNDILRRDLHSVTIDAGSHGCTVLTGTLDDPYTATTIHFVRGPESALVQIDHVVALGDAWETGAPDIGAAQRLNLANDPLNLLAVQGAANDRKGDADAAGWLPTNGAEDCPYVARQIAVKVKYQLWVTAGEQASMAGVLNGCPTQLLPTASATPLAAATAMQTSRTPAPVPVRPAPVTPAPATHAAAPAPAPAPAPPPAQHPAGATAVCNDGTFSYAAHHQGSCSHHHGVAQFFS